MTYSVPLSGVGHTAIETARLRADERRRTDRLFDDPYAEAFVAASARERSSDLPEELAGLVELMQAQVAVRTRFLDDYLLDACLTGVRQVVLLAAGLDTRAFRLAWPSEVRLFELDLPEVLSFKEWVLVRRAAWPRCDRVPVPVDFRTEWASALVTAGFRPDVPTAWVAEDLLVYLSGEDIARMVGVVSELSAPGSRMSCEYGVVGDTQDRPRDIPVLRQLRKGCKLQRSGPSIYVDTSCLLDRRGWEVRVCNAAPFAAVCGRGAAGHEVGGFLTAVRQTASVECRPLVWLSVLS